MIVTTWQFKYVYGKLSLELKSQPVHSTYWLLTVHVQCVCVYVCKRTIAASYVNTWCLYLLFSNLCQTFTISIKVSNFTYDSNHHKWMWILALYVEFRSIECKQKKYVKNIFLSTFFKILLFVKIKKNGSKCSKKKSFLSHFLFASIYRKVLVINHFCANPITFQSHLYTKNIPKKITMDDTIVQNMDTLLMNWILRITVAMPIIIESMQIMWGCLLVKEF